MVGTKPIGLPSARHFLMSARQLGIDGVCSMADLAARFYPSLPELFDLRAELQRVRAPRLEAERFVAVGKRALAVALLRAGIGAVRVRRHEAPVEPEGAVE